MFNIGPLEMVMLAIVGLIVIGPERLPGLARDAARMLRNLRDAATGARKQLREELGPEFADMDLRNLNPRTMVQQAVFGDDVDLRKLNPRTALQDLIMGDDDDKPASPGGPISMTKPASSTAPAPTPTPDRPRPRPRPTPAASEFDDIT